MVPGMLCMALHNSEQAYITMYSRYCDIWGKQLENTQYIRKVVQLTTAYVDVTLTLTLTLTLNVYSDFS